MNTATLRPGDARWRYPAASSECLHRSPDANGTRYCYLCTLHDGHKGEHVAHTTDSDGWKIVARWAKNE